MAFCGDDIQDIEPMKIVGYSFAPSNAQLSVKSVANFISSYSGGSGFVRDICNLFQTVRNK